MPANVEAMSTKPEQDDKLYEALVEVAEDFEVGFGPASLWRLIAAMDARYLIDAVDTEDGSDGKQDVRAEVCATGTRGDGGKVRRGAPVDARAHEEAPRADRASDPGVSDRRGAHAVASLLGRIREIASWLGDTGEDPLCAIANAVRETAERRTAPAEPLGTAGEAEGPDVRVSSLDGSLIDHAEPDAHRYVLASRLSSALLTVTRLEGVLQAIAGVMGLSREPTAEDVRQMGVYEFGQGEDKGRFEANKNREDNITARIQLTLEDIERGVEATKCGPGATPNALHAHRIALAHDAARTELAETWSILTGWDAHRYNGGTIENASALSAAKAIKATLGNDLHVWAGVQKIKVALDTFRELLANMPGTLVDRVRALKSEVEMLRANAEKRCRCVIVNAENDKDPRSCPEHAYDAGRRYERYTFVAERMKANDVAANRVGWEAMREAAGAVCDDDADLFARVKATAECRMLRTAAASIRALPYMPPPSATPHAGVTGPMTPTRHGIVIRELPFVCSNVQWLRIGRYDSTGRRSLWMHIDGEDEKGDALAIELCSGREGDDAYVRIDPTNPQWPDLSDVLERVYFYHGEPHEEGKVK